VFIDVEYGASTISDTEYRNIGLPLFAQEDTDVSFYSVLVGYNILPGEVYWSREKTLLTSLYLLAGVGSVNINDDNFVSLNFGFGVRLDLGGGKNIRVEARDRMIDSDILGSDKITNNTEMHIGMSWSF
jgi:outer membrane beta-barrel protein